MKMDIFPLFFCFCLFFICLFFIFLSFYRSQRDFQESLALNTLNVDARPEFASRNRTGIERLRSEPLVQQEGVYTALSPESMMVIILTTKLEFLNISLIQKGTKECAIHCTSFFQFLAVLLCSLHGPLSLHLYCYSDAPWLWTFDIKLFILYKFYCFIHLPLFFIKFFSSI